MRGQSWRILKRGMLRLGLCAVIGLGCTETPKRDTTASREPTATPPRATATPPKPEAAPGPALPLVENVSMQPFAAHVKRLLEALDYIGEPMLSAAERKSVQDACASDDPAAFKTIQQVLDAHCLLGVNINPESRVKVARGPARPRLVESGWRTFLVKVQNDAGSTAELQAECPNAQPVYRQVGGPEPEMSITEADVRDRWMDLSLFKDRPMDKTLSGLPVEYRIIQLFSRDRGQREATLSFNVQQGTQDIGFRNEAAVLFTIEPSAAVTLRVLDETGQPSTAGFVIRDERGRVYPSQAKRLAPDFFFHPQIYRHDGESIVLPAGTYTVAYSRGPEYRDETKTITVPSGAPELTETFTLNRWIHPAKLGWYSGDHHVHAAGCAHYTDPAQGVKPEDMMRQILGEDLNVGCVLSWGPCWYYQKEFFDGGVSPLSKPNHIMRYDVEVSGFPSDYTGHLCLLGLNEDDYPGTTRIEHWPAWDLPILQWGKQQGAVVGFSHSGWGLHTKDKSVPNLEIPPFDGIGANEYIVDVTYDAVDFISAVDTPWPFELNIWYHTNNAGFRTRLSGETDFPCIYGERVGLGRGYVQVDGQLAFDKWLAGVKAGRSYVSDGMAHLIDFKLNGLPVGTDSSEVRLTQPEPVLVNVRAAALLNENPRQGIRKRPIDQKPFWNVERARVGDTRKVAVELVVNGRKVAEQPIEADGTLHDLTFSVPIERSSWVAARVFASAHTNPIYVLVGNKPVRASAASVKWCLDSVEKCWESKSTAFKSRFSPDKLKDPDVVAKRQAEFDASVEAYEHARRVYRQLLSECEVE